MRLDGFDADFEFVGDLPRAIPSADEPEDFEFPRTQTIDGRRTGPRSDATGRVKV